MGHSTEAGDDTIVRDSSFDSALHQYTPYEVVMTTGGFPSMSLCRECALYLVFPLRPFELVWIGFNCNRYYFQDPYDMTMGLHELKAGYMSTSHGSICILHSASAVARISLHVDSTVWTLYLSMWNRVLITMEMVSLLCLNVNLKITYPM